MYISKYVLLSSGFPFHFDDGVFSCAEAFQFDIVPLLYFFLFSLALGDILAKALLHEVSEILLPMFSSRIFQYFETF